MKKSWLLLLLLFTFQVIPLVGFARDGESDSNGVIVLLYHRLGAVVENDMTVKTAVFASQLEYLQTHGYTVIPLRSLIDYMSGRAPHPPDRSIVITVDDGHKSVFTDMFPLIRRYHIPVTLFIYPSAISNAKYAMTWQQLREMQDSGLVDIQSHTYWHPNFKKEKMRLSKDEYENLVHLQLGKSKEVLEQRLGIHVDMLAWPYGIYDDELINRARQSGYVAGFTLERRPVQRSDDFMVLPRYLITNQVQGALFAKLLAASSRRVNLKGTP